MRQQFRIEMFACGRSVASKKGVVLQRICTVRHFACMLLRLRTRKHDTNSAEDESMTNGDCINRSSTLQARFASSSVVAVLSALLLFPNAALADAQRTPPSRQPCKVVVGSGAVVCETPIAAEIGRDVLDAGGSAVDAAVAVGFALALTWPEAGNIAGGGYMLVVPADDDLVICLDYRETAPATATRDMFIDWTDRRHAKVAGTPGTVRGLADAHAKYGRLPWSDLVAPSIALARDGFTVDEYLAYSLNRVLDLKAVRTNPRFAEFRKVYAHPNTYLWSAGQTITQPDIAVTLESIASDGGKSFYHGALAQRIAEDMEQGDGLISTSDLASYQTITLPATHVQVRGYDIYGASLSSSGGTAVAMQLKLLDKLGLSNETDQPWTSQNVHLMTEVMRRVFRDRAAHLGDPAFVAVPDSLTSDEHLDHIASTIDRTAATRSVDIADGIAIEEPLPEGTETTHFSIVDQDGMAVSNTYTLEATFGCRVIVRGTGILLNNEMGDFNWIPGLTDRTGRIGTDANLVVGGKRMLSSQSPTIVKRDGNLTLAIGSPGGRTIINTVTEALVQKLFFDRSLVEALESPRFHHQWLPDEVVFESVDDGLFPSMIDDLQAKGHRLRFPKHNRQGSVQAIEYDAVISQVTAVSDWRRGGGAAATDPAAIMTTPSRNPVRLAD